MNGNFYVIQRFKLSWQLDHGLSRYQNYDKQAYFVYKLPIP